MKIVTISLDELETMIEAAVERAITRHTRSPDEIISITETAAYLKRSKPTVARMIKRGLPCHRNGPNAPPTFRRSEIDAWISRNSR